MKGLYLYCIRGKTENPPVVSSKGIDGKGKVFAVNYLELEAVVSKVSVEEYTSKEIQKKAREDLNWIKEKAFTHEKIVEEAMRQGDEILSLMPMRFGTIFKKKTGLEETLSRECHKIKKALKKVQDKQEWNVKAYLTDRKKFMQEIKKENKLIKEKEKEIPYLAEGIAFFVEEELNETIKKEMDKELERTVEGLFKSLEEQAVDSVKNKILEKELSGRCEPMVLNAAYLIHKEKIKDFKEEAESLNGKINAKGFCLEYSGPWPAYNFISY